jgi:hypothetical protein
MKINPSPRRVKQEDAWLSLGTGFRRGGKFSGRTSVFPDGKCKAFPDFRNVTMRKPLSSNE